jgi:2-amino-4-hydroxy-6-hydroxymethyldihydropteridine diphosphokinase
VVPHPGAAPPGLMSRDRAWFSLGSNLGDRVGYLKSAVDMLARSVGDLVVSSIYETMPLYVEDQPRFLNCVAAGWTLLNPLELLDVAQEVERMLGRVRDRPKGPRTIDVDLLLCGHRQHSDARLVLPHPGIRERAFVLVPLLELDPDLVDPTNGQTYRLCLDRIGARGVSYHREWDAP